VGALAAYIPQATPHYPGLPEVEDLTVHLAAPVGLATVPHGLLRLEGSWLTSPGASAGTRGRSWPWKICASPPSAYKYDDSHEVAKAILRYSANLGLDVVNYYELVLFSFLTGNADMHLKNLSLLHTPGLGYGLALAYDLAATTFVNPADTEELALTLNGRKKKLKPADFQQAAQRAGVTGKVLAGLFTRFTRVKPAWHRFIDDSFLSPELRQCTTRC